MAASFEAILTGLPAQTSFWRSLRPAVPFETYLANQQRLLVEADMRADLQASALQDRGGEQVFRKCLEANRRRKCAVHLIVVEQCENTIATHIDVRRVEFVEKAHGRTGEELINARRALVVLGSA
jgi:hypothetical protein